MKRGVARGVANSSEERYPSRANCSVRGHRIRIRPVHRSRVCQALLLKIVSSDVAPITIPMALALSAFQRLTPLGVASARRSLAPLSRPITHTRARGMSVSASADEKIVLVTGSTGRVGKEVVSRLSKMPGWRVRAATRDKADYATSLGAHETVVFDLEDESTWAPR